MPNSNVFTGLDGAISVAVESGPEGDAAKTVADTYGLAPIGRATGVTVEVVSEMKPFHEMGQRYATELRPGNVNIRGSIARLSGSPEHTEQEIDLIFITKDLERVGDHATNIAEEVILAAEAKNLKHAAKLGIQPR